MLPHQKVRYLPFLELNSFDEIVREFSLGKVIDPPEANNSGNESFKLRTEKGTFQVKSYIKSAEDPEHFAPVIQRELSYTKYLERVGVLVQQHLSFQPFLYNGKLTTITSFIEGEQLKQGIQTPQTISAIGTLLGQLHLKSAEYGASGAGYEQRNTFRDRVEANIEKIEHLLGISGQVFMPLLDMYTDLREKRQKTDLAIPRGLTHGELTYVHLLKVGNTFAILDFEGLKFVPHIFDFGQTLITMTYDGVTLHQDLVSTFFDAYKNVRKLSQKEKELIPTELSYNYLHKLEWRMTAMLNNANYIEPVKNSIINASSFIEQVKAIRID